MSKQSNVPSEAAQAAPATAPLMTSSELATILRGIAADLEIEKGSMSNESYGALIGGAAIQYNLMPATSFPGFMQLWTLFPKNPSAARQLVWKEETTTLPAASAKAAALAAKWGAPPAQA